LEPNLAIATLFSSISSLAKALEKKHPSPVMSAKPSMSTAGSETAMEDNEAHHRHCSVIKQRVFIVIGIVRTWSMSSRRAFIVPYRALT
jgi:hypothetical protein